MVAQVVAGGGALRIQHAGSGHRGDYGAVGSAPDLRVVVDRSAGGDYIQSRLRRASADAYGSRRQVSVQHAADIEFTGGGGSTCALVIAHYNIPCAGSRIIPRLPAQEDIVAAGG